MPPYINILKSGNLNRKQRWYIFGPDKAMVSDALELALDHVHSDDFTVAKSVFSGESASEGEIESRLDQTTIEDRSLVILLDADKYKHWDSLSVAVKDLAPQSFFVAVSNNDKEDKSTPVIRTFMGNPKATLVECKNMSSSDLVTWVETRLNIERAATRTLVEASRGDSEWLLNCVRKLQYLSNKEIILEDIESLVHKKGLPKFEASLIYQNKADALRYVLDGDLSTINLHSVVDILRKSALVHEASKSSGVSKRILTERTKIDASKIDQLRKIGKRYDRSTLFRNVSLIYSRRNGIFPLIDKWRAQALIERW